MFSEAAHFSSSGCRIWPEDQPGALQELSMKGKVLELNYCILSLKLCSVTQLISRLVDAV